MTVSIYVGNLAFSTDQSSLRSIFSPFGEVISASVVSDRDTGRSRGFGFVEMESDDARKAISSLDGTEQDGRRIKVNQARERVAR